MRTSILSLAAAAVFATASLVHAQTPAPEATPVPSASPAKHHRVKKATPAPAATPATAAAPAPAATAAPAPATAASSPAPAKMTRAQKKAARAAASPGPTEVPETTTAPGGGAGMVWVNTKSHVYHDGKSRWYGKTKKGKYLSEKDALAEGDKAAPHDD